MTGIREELRIREIQYLLGFSMNKGDVEGNRHTLCIAFFWALSIEDLI
jgi:hypothetical protein